MYTIYRKANKKLYGCEYPNFKNMTITEKTPHGWGKHIFIITESMFNGRYVFLNFIPFSGSNQIPQLKFYNESSKEYLETYKMITKCIKTAHTKYRASKVFELFIDWLLYAWGDYRVQELPKEIDEQLNEFWYKNFIGSLFFQYPADYLGRLAQEISVGKESSYIPTPPHIAEFITKLTCDKNDKKPDVICDLCAGSGAMLLPASNYSLQVYGVEIDPLLHKILILNSYFYIPWAIFKSEETSVEIFNEINKMQFSREVSKE